MSNIHENKSNGEKSYIANHSYEFSKFRSLVKDNTNFQSVQKQGKSFFSNAKSDLGNLIVATSEIKEGKFLEAIQRFEFILKKDPYYESAHSLYINLLLKVNNTIKLQKALFSAHKYNPENHDFLNLLGKHLIGIGKKKESLPYFESAVEKNPHSCQYWIELGFTYLTLRNIDMASLCLKTAQDIDYNNKQCYQLRGLLLQDDLKYKEAIKTFQKGLELYPHDQNLILNLAILYLKTNNMKKGYELYNLVEISSRTNLHGAINYTITDKTKVHINEIKDLTKADLKLNKKIKILVFFEQGFGDYLNFLRFLKPLADMGHLITALGPHDSIIPLLQYSNCPKNISLETKINNEDVQFFHRKTIIGNLPFLLDFTDKMPSPIIFDKIKIEKHNKPLLSKFKKLLKGNVNIGVSWKGSKRHLGDEARSIDLELFSKIFKNENYRFFVIDKELSDKDKHFLKKFSNVYLCDRLINDWVDTAIIVSNLNKIISVDTSLAHIGGTLEIPTKVLLPADPDWRWGVKGSRTKWYKTVSLIRQKDRDNWEDVIKDLVKNP